MIRLRCMIPALLLALAFSPVGARADQPFADLVDDVNAKMVKLFGSGGFKGLAAYGTGLIVRADGYILTVASPMLDTRDLRVHLPDGRRYSAKVVVIEPQLDVALVKIDSKEELDLPFFNITESAKQPLLEPSSKVLAFSNQFQIASRDEPMSVQRGIIAAYTKLHGRRGIHQATFDGNVYVLDAITNNPGAAGGAVTNRNGQLIGLIGKELKNELSNTWINYAIPIQTTLEVIEDDKKRTVSIVEIVEKREKYVASKADKSKEKKNNFHGIVTVPNPVDLTPPYVEMVIPNAPAAKAGLKPDDLIVYVDGEQVPSINALNDVLGRYNPETAVKIEVRRADKLQTLTLTMAKPLVPPKPRPKPVEPKDDKDK